MNIIKIILLLFLFNLAAVKRSTAKSDDFCVWNDINAIKKFRTSSVSLYGEFYTKQNSSIIDKLSIGLKGDHAFKSWLTGGAGFSLMNYNRITYHENIDRFYFQMEPSWHLSHFYFGFRERMQITLYPQTQSNAQTTYYWRNRFEIVFKKPKKKLEPLVDVESFYLCKDLDLSLFNEVRITLGANYYLAKNQKFKMYGMMTDGSVLNRYILGLSYEFKL